jgi:two-component system, OmpR family, response regulator ChvI
MAALAKNFGARVIKNVGDALIFYFPNTSNSNNRIAFKEAFECFNAIIAARDLINERLVGEHLPEVSYRISADYGQVKVGRTGPSGTEDLFGPTVNICSKINPMAEENGIVIGGDLYRVIKRFSFEQDFEFREANGYNIGFKQSYPLYFVKRRQKIVPSTDNKLLMPATKSVTSHSVPKVDIVATLTRNHTIMVVDDEPDVLATINSFLLQGGRYKVEAFTDPYKALQTFARSQPRHFDLIILDIRMRSMNGIQLYQRLKAIDPHIKVIFLTALDAAEELVSVLEGLSSVDVMKKPIGKKHFLQRIKEFVRDSSPSSTSAGNTSLS